MSSDRVLYPSAKKLKEAYIGLLELVCSKKRATFSAMECISAICEHNNWIIERDHAENIKMVGTTKKAKGLLIQLASLGYIQDFVDEEGKVYPVIKEIAVYNPETKINYYPIEKVLLAIGDDRIMSGILEPDERLTFCRKAVIPADRAELTSSDDISEEVARLNLAAQITCEKEEVIETSFISLNKDTVLLNPEISQIDEDSETLSEVDGGEPCGSLI
jgi:hypothetical protein